MEKTLAGTDWARRIAALLRPMPLGAEAGLQTTLDEQGELLAAIGTAVQGIAEGIIARRIGLYDYVEAYDGNDSDTLFLQHDPIEYITSVSINGTDYTAEGEGDTPTYPPPTIVVNDIRNGIQRTDSGVFSAGRKNVIVSYTAGLDPTANDAMVQALAFWGAQLYKRKDQLGIASTNVMGIQTTFRDSIPEIVTEVLAPYARTFLP